MLNRLRAFTASCTLDRAADAAPGPIADAHRALLDSRPHLTPAPPGLHARVMEHLDEPAPARPITTRFPLAAALAAALALALGLAAFLSRPTPPASPTTAAALPDLPVDAGPVLRLVANNIDGPLSDQNRKILDDTRRATRAVAHCIPFLPGE